MFVEWRLYLGHTMLRILMPSTLLPADKVVVPGQERQSERTSGYFSPLYPYHAHPHTMNIQVRDRVSLREQLIIVPTH